MPRKFELSAVLLIAMNTCLAAAERICPQLPQNSGLELVYREGPDFDLCYAINPSSKADEFGIYLGHHPSADLQPEHLIGTGTAGGFSINWYKRDALEYSGRPHSASLNRQALFTIGKSLQAHIWLTALNQKELERKLLILQGLKFQ